MWCCQASLTARIYTRQPDAEQIARSKEVIASLSIDDLIEKDFLSLSLGQAKRILIARAIVHKPRLLILDELGAGLDRESKKTGHGNSSGPD